MLLIDRYLISSWFKLFLIILGFFVAMLIAQEAYNHFLDLLREQFSLIKIFDFILVSILSNVLVLIPVTLFVSIIFTFISLQKSNQITVLKSCGLSLFRISIPFFIIASGIAILSYLIASFFITGIIERKNAYIQILEPHSYTQKSSNSNQILTYQNHSDKRLWFIEAFNINQSKGAYTILHQLNDLGIEVGRIIAQESTYDNDLKTWTFNNGTEVRFDETTGDPIQSISFKTKQFIDLEENPEDFLLFDQEIASLSLNKVNYILSILPNISEQRLKYEIKYYSFFATPLLSIILVGISIPFLSRGIRNNTMLGPIHAFLLLITFFMTNSLTVALGLNWGLPAVLTAFLPYFIFLILSIKLYWKQ